MWRVLRMFFLVSAKRGMTFISRQLMARIAAAFEACGSVHCTVYTSSGGAATPRLGSPLPQVYFLLYMCISMIRGSMLSKCN